MSLKSFIKVVDKNHNQIKLGDIVEVVLEDNKMQQKIEFKPLKIKGINVVGIKGSELWELDESKRIPIAINVEIIDMDIMTAKL